MSRLFNRKFVVVTVVCLTAGWMTIAVNGEQKKTKITQAKKPAALDTAHSIESTELTQFKVSKQVFFPVLTQREQQIQDALNADTECDFADSRLADVMDFFAERHGLTILIFSNDLGEEGLTVDEPVNLSLKGIALKHVLGLILEPLGLTYVVDRGLVKITTIIKADKMLKMRVYPVGDFGTTPEDYQSLEAAIRNAGLGVWRERKTLTPSQPVQAGGAGGAGGGFFQVGGGGFGGGGAVGADGGFSGDSGMGPSSPVYEKGEGGTISVVRQSRSLVISQTYHAHNAIVELLTQLRQARDLD